MALHHFHNEWDWEFNVPLLIHYLWFLNANIHPLSNMRMIKIIKLGIFFFFSNTTLIHLHHISVFPVSDTKLTLLRYSYFQHKLDIQKGFLVSITTWNLPTGFPVSDIWPFSQYFLSQRPGENLEYYSTSYNHLQYHAILLNGHDVRRYHPSNRQSMLTGPKVMTMLTEKVYQGQPTISMCIKYRCSKYMYIVLFKQCISAGILYVLYCFLSQQFSKSGESNTLFQ